MSPLLPQEQARRAAERGLRVVVGDDPAAGAEISLTVPRGVVWELLTVQAILTADATAATRAARLLLDDGTREFYRIGSGTNQNAGDVFVYTWAVGQGVNTAFAAAVTVALPTPPFLLPGGYRIRTSVLNLQAGDNWAAPVLLVREVGGPVRADELEQARAAYRETVGAAAAGEEG